MWLFLTKRVSHHSISRTLHKCANVGRTNKKIGRSVSKTAMSTPGTK